MTDYFTSIAGILAQSDPGIFTYQDATIAALQGHGTFPLPARAVSFVTTPKAIYTWAPGEHRDDGLDFVRPLDRQGTRGRWVRVAAGNTEENFYDTTGGVQAQSDPGLYTFLVPSSAALSVLRTHPLPARGLAILTAAAPANDVFAWSEDESRDDGVNFLRPLDRAGTRGRWVRVVGGSLEPDSGEETPLTIFGADLLEWLDGDLDTNVGGNWIGQVAGSVFAPANAPTYSATLVDGQGGFSYDRPSAQRHDNVTLDLPAPGTQAFAEIMVARQNAWNSGGTLIGATVGLTTARIHQGGVTPQIQMNNASSVNTNGGAAIAAWALIIAEYTNSTSDRLVVGATATTGANAGANDPAAGRQIGGSASASHGSFSTPFILWVNMGVDYATKLADLIAYINVRYPSVATL